MRESDDSRGRAPINRRNFLKTVSAAGAGVAAGAVAAAQAGEQEDQGGLQTKNPYGQVPGGGITLPPYYAPTPSIKNATTYFPESEPLGAEEMRITFMGSNPFPPRKEQAGTCIMVELGDPPKRFFFDFGPGCLRNIIAQQVPVQMVNDIFLSHLHVDHYGDLPYLQAFAPFAGRYYPLRVHGPSGRTPELGTKAMCDAMMKMLRWHTESFNIFPIGDGYEIEANEFDFRDDNGICYDKDGVVVRHWRRSHSVDGSSAYRLDWNGLSFVWTGDGRPDERTAEYAKGVDVFVTELVLDTAQLITKKFGWPALMWNYIIDIYHTPHYAVGYLMKEVNPRIGLVTHLSYDHELVGELIAGVRLFWDGLFQLGAPDGVVVNLTKDRIWNRRVASPDDANSRGPRPADVKVLFPDPNAPLPPARNKRADMVEASTIKAEIDPRKYTPPGLLRTPILEMPRGLTAAKLFGAAKKK